MKTILTFIYCFFVFLSIGQKFDSGYVVNAEHDTLYGKLNITVNTIIKFNHNGSKSKLKKLDLLDYGEVKKHEFYSYYAKTAFPHITRRGIIYLNSGDSIHAYIFKESARKINYYNLQKEKAKGKIADIDAYHIFSETGKINRYERLAVPRTYKAIIGVKNKDNDKHDLYFGRELAIGKIDLYSTYSSTSSFSGGMHTAPAMSNELTLVYLLKKGEEVKIIPRNKLSLQSGDLLKSMIKDYPELEAKVGTKGYRIKNIKKIIEEYNQRK